jgi:hypothetical protein
VPGSGYGAAAVAVAGKIGGAYRFNSSAEYVDFGDVADFDFGLSDFSVSFWVKGGAADDAFLTKSASDGPYDGIYLYESDSQNTYTWYGPGYNKFDEDGSDGEWHYLSAVREGTGTDEFKVYTDGVEANTATLGTDLTNSLNFMMHRWADWASTNAVTQMDEVRLSDTARTADWIEASYLSQNGTFNFCTFGGEGAGDYVAQIAGDGDGDSDISTGWKRFRFDLGTLTAGPHTVIIGGYNNKKTDNDETTIIIDDVIILK